MDLEAIKEEITTFLRGKLMPTQLSSDSSITYGTNANYYMAQSFYPLSTVHRPQAKTSRQTPVDVKVKLYKIGSPDGGVLLSIQGDSNGNPSGIDLPNIETALVSQDEVQTSAIEITKTLVFKDYIGSKTPYWLVLTAQNTPSDINKYAVLKDATDPFSLGSMKFQSYSGPTWNNLDGDLYFKINVPNWIFPDYPRSDLGDKSYPRIAVEIISRRRVMPKWISCTVIEYVLGLSIIIYSMHQDELDLITKWVDYWIVKNRLLFTTFWYLLPATGSLAPTVTPGDQFVKALNYDVHYIQNVS